MIVITKGLKELGDRGLKETIQRVVDKVARFFGRGGGNPGEAANRAMHEAYKDGLRAAMQKPSVTDENLGALLNSLYRPGAKVGSGSTAAAVRQELATGRSVGGKLHSQKAGDYIKGLQRWINGNPGASLGDRAAAENVLKDLQNAMSGR